MLQQLINQLNEAMQAIQSLQIQPTEYNCTRIVTALHAIQDAAQIGAELNKQIPAASDAAAADPAEDRDEN